MHNFKKGSVHLISGFGISHNTHAGSVVESRMFIVDCIILLLYSFLR